VHVDNEGKLVLGSEIELDPITDKLICARTYFYKNKISDFKLSIEGYLKIAEEMNKLPGAKEAKKRELVKNEFLIEEPDFYVKKGMLDSSRLEAFNFIDNYGKRE